ncbi:class I SAM-dependent methyltransferase [Pseudomonadales bacterium]|nr:class I SAM-dependent methyltransferase [Pseudomonadales bacterium]
MKGQTGGNCHLGIKTESFLMNVARLLGLEKLRWSLRRIHCPVSNSALVLEVGSGGNPYPRSNVLVDAYEDTSERHWAPLVHDRPTVLADGEKLPFKDKVFDYVIASHVLEHTTDPASFLAELQRVARAGYIETPDAFMERINPYKDHRLEVTVRNDALIIRKKPQWIMDVELVEMYEPRAKLRVTHDLIPKYPEDFHMRYYWSENINYKLLNPEVDATWQPESAISAPVSLSALVRIKTGLREIWLGSLRWIFSQRSRNKKIDLLPLLQCPSCGASEFVSERSELVVCGGCAAQYYYRNHILIMNEVSES